MWSSTVCVIPAFMKKKSKALDLELTSSSMLIETGDKKMKKLLIIYYSWSNGNTERIAKMLQSETDSDILKIDTVVPYSGSYDDVVNQGQNEVQRGYEPEIKPLDINIADYDIIAVGTPYMVVHNGSGCKNISAPTGFYRKDSSTFYDKWWLARTCNKGYESSLQRRKCGLRYADTV